MPKYRGAAPIQWAIAQGENTTGVTTIRIDAGLDTGDILLQQELPIAENDTAVTLSPKLSAIGSDLMVTTLRGLQAGSIIPRKQGDAQSTRAPILKKEDGLIDFSRAASEILNRLRGFQPWPGAFTKFRGKVMQVFRAVALDETLPIAQLQANESRLLVGCGHGTSIELLELQLEGKKRTSAADFIRGYRPQPGEKLGS